MTIDEIRELIQLLSDTGIAELEVQRGDNRVRIRKSFAVDGGFTEGSVVVQTAVPPVSAAPPVAAQPAVLRAETPSVKSAPDLIYAKSPIVGTFYEAASPEAPPFVSIGEHVTPGKVLCIIESMKLMNEIECESAGTVMAKLVENGHAVEYGEALLKIRPR